jgi:hypothetical protein
VSRANRRKRFSNPDLDLRIPSITAGLTGVIDFRHNAVDILRNASASTESISANGTRINPRTGLVEQAVANVARIERAGVRVEPAGTNLVVQSRDLSTSWATDSNRGTVVTNQFVGVWGTQTMDKLEKNAESAAYRYQVVDGLANNTTYTLSVDVAAGTGVRWVRLSGVIEGLVTGARCWFDLLNGVVGTQTNCTGRIEANPDGSWRIGMTWNTGTISATKTVLPCRIVNADNDAFADTLSVGDRAFFENMQLVTGSDWGSRIPTTTTAVTRDGDRLGHAAATLMAAASGSLGMTIRPAVASQTCRLLDASADGDNSFYLGLAAGKPYFKIDRATVEQAALTATDAIAAAAERRVFITWDADDVRMYVNGADAKADTSATMPDALNATVFFGSDGTANNFNGHIRDVILYSGSMLAEHALEDYRDSLRRFP